MSAESPADPRSAAAELHYTRFSGAEAFEALLGRHGLVYYADIVAHESAHSHVWRAVHGECEVYLATAEDPRSTGTCRGDDYGSYEPGYASYTAVWGDCPFVLSLFEDVVNSAVQIKGEFKPLTAGDGEVLANYVSGVESA